MRELRLFGARCVGARVSSLSLLLNGVLQKLAAPGKDLRARARQRAWRRDLRTKEQDLGTKDRFRGKRQKERAEWLRCAWVVAK